jgi:hypothetical protein
MDDLFPNLAAEGFTTTSAASRRYNCIAWAAGRADAWWWPDPQFVCYWPDAAPRRETLDAFVAAFETLRYQRCSEADADDGFEKIAIYQSGGLPTHAARQLPDGAWTSKLGRNIDITHTLRGLEGPEYGQVAIFMRRPAQ